MSKKIAMVRATNIVPVDGIVRPISKVPYIKKEKDTCFYSTLIGILKKKGIIEEIDYSRFGDDEYLEEYNKKVNEIMKEYMPYSSDYNPVVLWALNGIVPDDINNTFSNKNVAIVDDIDEHVEDIISIMPTDTATEGEYKISTNGAILIRRNVFESLSMKEKKQMVEGKARIILFEVDIKEAVETYLESKEEYDKEELTLNRSYGGYLRSETSEQTKSKIKEIAETNNIPEVLYFNMLARPEEYGEAFRGKNIYENTMTVMDFYKETFLDYMFKRFENGRSDEDIANMEKMKLNLIKYPEVPDYNIKLVEYIDEFGIDKYKKEIAIYNGRLEELKERGELPTPREIVEAKENKKYINLLEKIENIDIDLGNEDIE